MSDSLMIIAGEVSGDMHAAKVVRELKKMRPDLTCWGVGGDELQAEGAELLYEVEEMAVLGFAEVLRKYRFFKQAFDRLLEEADRRKPKAALLIDYPGFNLRMAARLKARGIKVLYYICPQVWAWNRKRIPEMAKHLDRLMVIFPFEVEVFKKTPLRVDFVGHPLVEELQELKSGTLLPLPWTSPKKLALLPGSRTQEVEHILPILLETAREIHRRDRETGFVVAAPPRQRERIEALVAEAEELPDDFFVVTGQSREALRQATAAIVASGTATLESALLGCPTLVVYKTAWLNYWIGRMLIRIPWLGIVNITAGQEICPEFLQKRARPGLLAPAALSLLCKSERRQNMLQVFREIELLLGRSRVEHNVAAIVAEELAGT
jgi:lipid-A-disaccharide synthase